MKVIISENVVTAVAGTGNATKLHRLLAFASQGRHTIILDPPSCLDAWLASIDEGSRGDYQKAIDLSARDAAVLASDAGTVRIDQAATEVWADPEATLPLDFALRVLDEKLSFLVEDSGADWNFLQGILPKSQRERLQHYVAQGWAGPVHCGGSGIMARLEERFGKAHEGLRTALMFDNDRLHPNELEESWQPKDSGIKNHECNAFKWEQFAKENLPRRYWRLRRRFIESYMPKSELKTAIAADKNSTFDAFWRLPPESRWHYNMKLGLAKDKPHQARQIDLYSAIDADDKEALQPGFGTKLAKHYKHALQREFDWDEAAREEVKTNLVPLMRLL